MRSVGAAIAAVLATADPRAKAMGARAIARDWRAGRLTWGFVPLPDRPARPDTPELLPPNRMPKRGKGGSERGRQALWHALAHIEFVAIDLALDMAARFGAERGRAFVGDFLSIAAEEAMHFALIERHLRALGSHYGALPAHDGLWDAAFATRHDVAATSRPPRSSASAPPATNAARASSNESLTTKSATSPQGQSTSSRSRPNGANLRKSFFKG